MTTGSLRGAAAIVTGGGSADEGIGNGRAAAIRLADEGATVAVLDIDDSARATVDMIVQRGGRASAHVCDVTDPAQVGSVVDHVAAVTGQVDVLFNNVGVAGSPGSVVDVDLAGWERCLSINLTSMVIVSRFVIPYMAAGDGGSIVNMSSLAGLRGGHAGIAYATTKGAVVNLTRAMASQHGRQGIRVNAVAPGLVHTPMVSTRSGPDAGFRTRRAELNVLGTEGTAWDVAEAVLYLAGPAARWVTGTVLPVDAGASSHSEAIQVSVTDDGSTPVPVRG